MHTLAKYVWAVSGLLLLPLSTQRKMEKGNPLYWGYMFRKTNTNIITKLFYFARAHTINYSARECSGCTVQSMYKWQATMWRSLICCFFLLFFLHFFVTFFFLLTSNNRHSCSHFISVDFRSENFVCVCRSSCCVYVHFIRKLRHTFLTAM